jgi:GxxExxY protein
VEVERVAAEVVDSGLKIHKVLGPGLLESIYENCLCRELQTRGIDCQRQVSLPVVYEGVRLDAAYRIDVIVEHTIIVEVKAVEALTVLHEAQILTYLKLGNYRLGFLMNFNVVLFKNGIKRFIR